MVAIDFRSWKITLNPVEHHSEPDGAALSLLRSNRRGIWTDDRTWCPYGTFHARENAPDQMRVGRCARKTLLWKFIADRLANFYVGSWLTTA
jgi:hypothetical protein